MIQARRYAVSGLVQGVGFRLFTQDAARREGLTGAVRNLADGRVEVFATGEAGALERFERALHGGPPLARVDRVGVEATTPDLSATGFRVRES